jgi:hypothetical protein
MTPPVPGDEGVLRALYALARVAHEGECYPGALVLRGYERATLATLLAHGWVRLRAGGSLVATHDGRTILGVVLAITPRVRTT